MKLKNNKDKLKTNKIKKKKIKDLPKKQKFKRLHKGHIALLEYKKSYTQFYYGIFGLKILKSGRITIKQLNAAKQIINKFIRKKEKL
jgi:ribosomal protein L16/L10AE